MSRLYLELKLAKACSGLTTMCSRQEVERQSQIPRLLWTDAGWLCVMWVWTASRPSSGCTAPAWAGPADTPTQHELSPQTEPADALWSEQSAQPDMPYSSASACEEWQRTSRGELRTNTDIFSEREEFRTNRHEQTTARFRQQGFQADLTLIHHFIGWRTNLLGELLQLIIDVRSRISINLSTL